MLNEKVSKNNEEIMDVDRIFFSNGKRATTAKRCYVSYNRVFAVRYLQNVFALVFAARLGVFPPCFCEQLNSPYYGLFFRPRFHTFPHFLAPLSRRSTINLDQVWHQADEIEANQGMKKLHVQYTYFLSALNTKRYFHLTEAMSIFFSPFEMLFPRFALKICNMCFAH